MGLDDVLELLKDGEWHCVEDIKERARLTDLQSKLVIHFLTTHGFCDFAGGKVRMKMEVLTILNELEGVNEWRKEKRG